MLQNGNGFLLLCADHALCSLIRVEKLHVYAHASVHCNYTVISRPDLPIVLIRIHNNYSTYS